jgi:hypothetical protein
MKSRVELGWRIDAQVYGEPCISADTRGIHLDIGFVRGAAGEAADEADIAVTGVSIAWRIYRSNQSSNKSSVIWSGECIGDDYRSAGAVFERERDKKEERTRDQAKS